VREANLFGQHDHWRFQPQRFSLAQNATTRVYPWALTESMAHDERETPPPNQLESRT